ncbi:hypothetical protein [Methylobacterium sp. SyP6R]|uniref:hypothetical protein n=1 Tax=Methylobacterium sp. SyP6R TaxID=2718876 RepID=UPI001F48BFE2|nr:hypothetical protein [Methylobacterium sp. SyP6R]MCF4127616.1 hypothetical protein [Methylobacterium sp. SyP6R]
MMLIEGPTPDMPAHKPGFVVVAAGAKGIVALTGGARLTWGERMFGGYSSYYHVDVRPQAVDLPKVRCASVRAGIDFDVAVQLTVKIVDPARAVSEGLGDPARFLAQRVRRIAEDRALRADVSHAAEAKRAIETDLRALAVDPAIGVIDATADVRPDANAMTLLRRIAEETLVREADAAEARINKARREEIVRLLDSPDELLAQTLVTKDENFRAALNMKLEQFAGDRQRQIDFLKLLIDIKVIEPHDLHERYGGLIEAAIGALRPPGSLALPPASGAAPAKS